MRPLLSSFVIIQIGAGILTTIYVEVGCGVGVITRRADIGDFRISRRLKVLPRREVCR